MMIRSDVCCWLIGEVSVRQFDWLEGQVLDGFGTGLNRDQFLGRRLSNEQRNLLLYPVSLRVQNRELNGHGKP